MVLRTLKPRLRPMQQRLRSMRAARDTAATPDMVRAWYHSKRWQQTRQRVLVRDNYICQQTGVILAGKPPADNSPVVHHRLPHHGDPDLFWDENNLEAVAKGWHDSEAQRAERGGMATG
jgi:5-methylcytosine-specific restriction endonuclease McrA